MYPPLPLNVPGVVIADQVFDADHRLIVAQEDWIGGGDVVIRVSNDGGVTWVEIAKFAGLNFHTYVIMGWNGVDTYMILCDELSGGDGIFLSTDGGDNWARATLTGDNAWDGTLEPSKLAFGLGAWWHMRNESTGDRVIWKSTDNGANWALFFDNGAVDLDFLISINHGLLAWDVDTTLGGIQQSADGVAAMSEVLTHAAAIWLRMDNNDAMFEDGNGNLFGIFQNTGNFFYYNDDPLDITSWREGVSIRQGDQGGVFSFSQSGFYKWVWDGTQTTRRGFNSGFTVEGNQTAWWTKDGRVWNASPMNRDANVSDNGKFAGNHSAAQGSGHRL
jgi:hypothetical protein